MTVAELIQKLEKLPANTQVILQKDAEGNAYSPLKGLDSDCVYIAVNQYSGIVYNTNWSADDAAMPQEHWDEILETKRVVVLHPVN